MGAEAQFTLVASVAALAFLGYVLWVIVADWGARRKIRREKRRLRNLRSIEPD